MNEPLPILITSAAYPSAPILTMSDPATRIARTIESITRWLDLAAGAPLVVCDGSGYDFGPHFAGPPTAGRGGLECLAFDNDFRLVAERGKGFGEGQIVAHALAHSRHLRECTHFAKCTGKLWVRNYSRFAGLRPPTILIDRDYRSAFRYKGCYSRFYVVRRSFYAAVLGRCHERVCDREGFWLETSFAAALGEIGCRGCDFPVRPEIAGWSGTTGDYEEHPPERFRKRLLRRARRLLV